MPPRPIPPISSVLSRLRSPASPISLCRRVPARRTLTSKPSHDPQPSSATTSSIQQLSNFKRPVAKCFLTAMFTFQLLYLAWLKLETDEIKDEKGAELAKLEGEARRLVPTSTSTS